MNSDYPVFYYKECDSTSTRARAFLESKQCSDYALFYADAQSAGRGRQGKSFYSPDKTGVYMSVIMPARTKLEDTVTVTARAAVAVCRTLCRLSQKPLKIKWVNDIYLQDKKVCGILCEKVGGHLIIGVGVNLETKKFPSELEGKAGSIGALDKGAVVSELADALFGMWSDDGYLGYYRENSCVIGKNITFVENGNEFYAKAVGIDENGGLIVENSEKSVKILRSGEISLYFC